jgi:hypothetical protein
VLAAVPYLGASFAHAARSVRVIAWLSLERRNAVDWNAIGAIADLASALAVAMSLVYVAVQVREFRKQSQIELANHFQENADRIRTQIWGSPEVAAFLERCHSTSEPLSPADRMRFGAYVSQRLWTWMHLHSFRASQDEWRRVRTVISTLLRCPAARELWLEQRSTLPPDLQREVDLLLETDRSRA